jgi:hypothetical protein
LSVRHDPECLICELKATIMLDITQRARVLEYVMTGTITRQSPWQREMFLATLHQMMSARRDLDSLSENPHSTT